MNVFYTAIALVAILTVIDAWKLEIRIKVSWKRALRRHVSCDGEEFCARTCKATGAGNHVDCFFSCLRMCEGQNEDASTKGGHLVPMPLDFNFYDCRGQGRFDRECLAANFGEDENDDALVRMFNLADADENGYITPSELSSANWIFEGQENIRASDTGDVVDPPGQLQTGSNGSGTKRNNDGEDIETRGHETTEEHLADLLSRLQEHLRQE